MCITYFFGSADTLVDESLIVDAEYSFPLGQHLAGAMPELCCSRSNASGAMPRAQLFPVKSRVSRALLRAYFQTQRYPVPNHAPCGASTCEVYRLMEVKSGILDIRLVRIPYATTEAKPRGLKHIYAPDAPPTHHSSQITA